MFLRGIWPETQVSGSSSFRAAGMGFADVGLEVYGEVKTDQTATVWELPHLGVH